MRLIAAFPYNLCYNKQILKTNSKILRIENDKSLRQVRNPSLDETLNNPSYPDSNIGNIKKLLDGFEGNITSSKWTRMCKCTKMTATRDINSLVQKSILIKHQSGGRSTSYALNNSF